MLRFAEYWEHFNGNELYLLGLNSDIEWDPGIVDRLIEVGDIWDLYRVGIGWVDARYDPKILDRLLLLAEGGWILYRVGRDWPDHRYNSMVAQALLDTKDMTWIEAALGRGGLAVWSLKRIKDLIMAWQGTGEEI